MSEPIVRQKILKESAPITKTLATHRGIIAEPNIEASASILESKSRIYNHAWALVLFFGGWYCLWSNTVVSAADPGFYHRQNLWQDSLIQASEAILRSHLTDGFIPFESETLYGGKPAQKISVNISGAKEMYLFVSGCPDEKWGVANWAEPILINKQSAVSLAQTNRFKVLDGRSELNMTLRSGLYDPIRMAGQEYKKGLHMQAYCVARVPLQQLYDIFEARIGIDDWSKGQGTVRFSVTGARTAERKRLWEKLMKDYPSGDARQQMRWEQEDRIWEKEWQPGDYQELVRRYAQAAYRVPPLAKTISDLAPQIKQAADLALARQHYYRSRQIDIAIARLKSFNFEGLRLAISDLSHSFAERYPHGATYLKQLDEFEAQRAQLAWPGSASTISDFEHGFALCQSLLQLQREALLANPLLDFDNLLLIKRKPMGAPRRSQWDDRGLGEYVGMPKQSSWGCGTMTGVDKWENEVVTLTHLRGQAQMKRLFKPQQTKLVTDVDLHWNAQKMLFAMPDARNLWQIYEIRADGSGLRQLTTGDHPDVHNYDPCYLPNGNITFISTAPLQGVPCNAGVIVGMMYLMDADGNNIRQICFEQDHDYTPSVMNDGRVLYLRWDYTDTPHVWNRILMTMNPDGTNQREFYGSNSYWPNAVFFARAIPGHATKLIGIVTGHHEGRVGDLVVFDSAKGRHEVDGVVQRIPGRGQKVEPLIEDKLTEHNWPKFLHPYPLNENYFLASGKPEPDSLWGVYLVDTFDNVICLYELEDYALLEPIPFHQKPAPPIIPDQTDPSRKDALVYISNIYEGPGLKGVPQGSVNQLRVFTYHFGYQRVAGIDHRVGSDGPWEVKRVLGTVPVEKDGSALFRIPAKTPLSVQPLDQEGKAIALMRSWMTAMPGEFLSCAGCHEGQGNAPATPRTTLALARSPSEITPWYGPVRGFSFAREVQPVLDQYCVSCHDGSASPNRHPMPDLRADQGKFVVYEHGKPALKMVERIDKESLVGKYAGVFEPSYIALRQYVRVGKLESDLHLLPPKEFHADTSELIQILKQGHHNVQLDPEAWDRLITWIDLNAPCHGTWTETTKIPFSSQPSRRRELRALYGGPDDDYETFISTISPKVNPVIPPSPKARIESPKASQWPFSATEAAARQQQAGRPATRKLDLGDGITMEFTYIPAGAFVMGDDSGSPVEQPLSVTKIEKPFWMGRFEVSNEQYRQFNPKHDSRFEHRTSWIFSDEYLGWRLNHPKQPVVRISWQEAMSFCEWLSHKTGNAISLPTEAQWEYACRSGSAQPFSYGDLDTDFAPYANMADVTIRDLAYQGWRPLAPDLMPRDDRFNDRALVTANIGSYQPNAWGLYDMHGNAAEWTRSVYKPYPYSNDNSDALNNNERIVRGGSWRDRPWRCRSGFRLNYPSYQRVFNVGFRVILEGDEIIKTAQNSQKGEKKP